VIAIDSNVLVYAHRQDSPFHQSAIAQLDKYAGSRSPWAIPWPCLHEFFAVVTHPRIYASPSSPAEASEQVLAWLASPSVTAIGETPKHWQRMSALLRDGGVVGGAIHDARIAAICLDHGVSEILTLDRDFEQFDGLKVRRLTPE